MADALRIIVRPLIDGSAEGTALRLDEPLSLWGGLDPASGTIIDRRHPQHGAHVAGRILVMRCGRGSSSASSILLEAVRRGTAPAAILLAEVDGILALGAAVARELYGQAPPIAVVPAAGFDALVDGCRLRLAGSLLSVAPPTLPSANLHGRSV